MVTLTINLPDETAAKLTAYAHSCGITIEQLLTPEAERIAAQTPLPQTAELSYDEWKRLFDAMLARTQSRADRYPPDFEADVSRESIYEGCGD